MSAADLTRIARITVLSAGATIVAFEWPIAAEQEQTSQVCRISGRARSATTPLPGVAIVVRAGEKVVAATSTEIDGTYRFNVAPNATYQVRAELTAFAPAARQLAVELPPCDKVLDLEFQLLSRSGGAAPATAPTTAPSGRGAASAT